MMKKRGWRITVSITPGTLNRRASKWIEFIQSSRCWRKVPRAAGEIMKPMRPILLIIVLVGVFYFLTNRGPRPSLSQSSTSVTRPEHVELAEAPGPLSLDAEEQLNGTDYNKACHSTSNLTQTQR